MRCAWSAILVAGCADNGGPRLEAVTPSAGARGTQVTVTGEHLCGESGNCETAGGEFQFGLDVPVVLASVIALEDTEAVLEVPQLAEIGSTEIVLTVNDRSSNALAFIVLAPSLAL